MATFGVEAIRYFSNARAAGVSDAADLTYTFNRSNGFDSQLSSAGHSRGFYWANTDCWETDIRASDQGGDDVHWVDDVDIFWIETHGGHEADVPDADADAADPSAVVLGGHFGQQRVVELQPGLIRRIGDHEQEG